jgi:hypothetical protein
VKRDRLVDYLRQIEKLAAECLRAVDELPAAAQETPVRTGTGKQGKAREALDFTLPVRPFVKKHARGLGGPAKFTLVLAHMAKGKSGVSVPLSSIRKAWDKMTGLLDDLNLAYPTRAKDKGWVDSPKTGTYVLLSGWTEIFSGKD